MPCDHAGGPELIDMAEKHLRGEGLPPEKWGGLRFRWAENLTGGMWASVIVEVERRGEHWIVTRLDRKGDALAVAETGFRSL